MSTQRMPSGSDGILHDSLELPYITFPLLSSFPEIEHASFLRPKNLELSREEEHFLHQKQGFSSICLLKQCHGSRILVVDSPGEQDEPADAMITQKTGLALSIRHADCQALIAYDPIQHVIAAAHVGWRGSSVNLPGLLIEELVRSFHVTPDTLHIAISPSLGPEHAYYPDYKNHLPQNMWDYQTSPGFFDFWRLTHDQLCSAGVNPDCILQARFCTYKHSEHCFSHRRSKEASRLKTLIALKA